MRVLNPRRKRLRLGILVWVLAAICAVITPHRSYNESAIQAAQGMPQAPNERKQHPRFDALVRNDFFAGMRGDLARLARGMRVCEEVLANNPRHAEALVWHGGGLLTLAAQAYTRGDWKLGDRLWNLGLKEMNDAVAFDPTNMPVKIGRSATIIGIAQSGWDPSDAQGVALLKSAVLDYEKVYRWQRDYFHNLSTHSRGELLFGLASGWSILGDHKKAREYLRLILKECKGTVYEQKARPWLDKKPPAVVQHDCTGCHV